MSYLKCPFRISQKKTPVRNKPGAKRPHELYKAYTPWENMVLRHHDARSRSLVAASLPGRGRIGRVGLSRPPRDAAIPSDGDPDGWLPLTTVFCHAAHHAGGVPLRR
jgi:hypothetical protein